MRGCSRIAALGLALFAVLVGCFPNRPGPRLQHFGDVAPQPGEPAPAFELVDVEGAVVDLADLIGERPLVLQLGSHTCPVYRGRRWGMQRLYEEYRDRVGFVVVYTREAHPVGSASPYVDREWVPFINRLVGVDFGDPATLDERLAQAKTSRDRLEIQIPVLVDGMDNEAWARYGSAPSPAFVIDDGGTVVLAVVWTDPKEIRETLEGLLAPLPTQDRPPSRNGR